MFNRKAHLFEAQAVFPDVLVRMLDRKVMMFDDYLVLVEVQMVLPDRHLTMLRWKLTGFQGEALLRCGAMVMMEVETGVLNGEGGLWPHC